jgi:hypothetical protein
MPLWRQSAGPPALQPDDKHRLSPGIVCAGPGLEVVNNVLAFDLESCNSRTFLFNYCLACLRIEGLHVAVDLSYHLSLGVGWRSLEPEVLLRYLDELRAMASR